jgi:hypothetical protein
MHLWNWNGNFNLSYKAMFFAQHACNLSVQFPVCSILTLNHDLLMYNASPLFSAVYKYRPITNLYRNGCGLSKCGPLISLTSHTLSFGRGSGSTIQWFILKELVSTAKSWIPLNCVHEAAARWNALCVASLLEEVRDNCTIAR